MTIILQSEDIKKYVQLNEKLIPIIEDAFKNLAQGKTTISPILRLDIEKYHGETGVQDTAIARHTFNIALKKKLGIEV